MVPILARFRALYEQSTIPLGKLCLHLGITPDMLTASSLLVSGIAAFVIIQGAYWWGIVLVLIVGIFDSLDGSTARTVFDHVVDRYAEFLIMLGVMLSGAVSASWTFFALVGMLMARV